MNADLAAAAPVAGALAAASPTLQPGAGLDTSKARRAASSADNLFEYMDGNAEGYLIYGFQKMHGVTCTEGRRHLGDRHLRHGGRRLGVRHVRRQPRPAAAGAAIGMGGQIVPRRAIFAKGQYYVEIAARSRGRPHRRAAGVDGGAREACARQHDSPHGALLVPPRRSSSRCGWCRRACWACAC